MMTGTFTRRGLAALVAASLLPYPAPPLPRKP